MNSLRKTVTRQHRGCDLNPGPTLPESSTLTTQLPSHPLVMLTIVIGDCTLDSVFTEAHVLSVL